MKTQAVSDNQYFLGTTIPGAIAWRAEHTPDAVAIRYKYFGIWHELNWREYRQMMLHCAAGLEANGLEKGDKIGLVGDNIYEILVIESATHLLGGISVGIYQNSLAEEMAEIIDYTDIKIIFAENQEQADKIEEMKFLGDTDRLPKVTRVIYQDPRGMENYHLGFFKNIENVLEEGEKRYEQNPDKYDGMFSHIHKDDICHFSLTSGTSGRSKAAMLTHHNLLSMGVRLSETDTFELQDEYVSFLPFAWIGEQMISFGLAPAVGLTVNFPESPESLMSDMAEIGPHVIFSSPKMWENFQTRIWLKISETYKLNHLLYNAYLNLGRRLAVKSMSGQPLSRGEHLLRFFGRLMIFRPILNALGILRLRRVYTGGAALGPDLFAYFHALGINLKQIYGQTEITGIAYLHRDGDVKHDTVGKPLPGTECKISENGEILSKSSAICKGYYKMEEESQKLIDDGWLHSGDAGYVDKDGHLVVIDRIQDVMRNRQGEVFSPMFIENKLKFSPFIKEAAIFGNERDFVACFINIDPETVGKWAEDHKVGYTTYMDLSAKDEVAALILEEIKTINEGLDKDYMKIRRMLLLQKLLDSDDEELTRTGKLRRNVVNKVYHEMIEALYTPGLEKKMFNILFTYQDGQKVTEKRDVKIYNLP